ncbi:hypothetical protein QP174_11310 [Sphingomonas aerolata]
MNCDSELNWLNATSPSRPIRPIGVSNEIGDQHRPRRIRLVRHVAKREFAGASNVELAVEVERHLGAQVDLAAGAALDQVGRRCLVDVDRCHQFGRDVAPQDCAAVVRAEDLAAVQPRRDARQATDLNARPLDRIMVGIAQRGKADDRDARDALQDFGDRVVGQLAGIIGDDRVDDRLAATLALVGSLERGATAGDDDITVPGRIGRGLTDLLSRRRSLGRVGRHGLRFRLRPCSAARACCQQRRKRHTDPHRDRHTPAWPRIQNERLHNPSPCRSASDAPHQQRRICKRMLPLPPLG